MKVWVLTKKNRLKTYLAERLREEAKELGIKLRHVCPENFEIVEPPEFSNKVYYKGEYLDIPDLLITRITGMSYFSYALVRFLKRMGVVVMNNASAIELAEDKLRTVQVLSAKSLPIPKSILAKTPIDIDFVAKELGFPIVMKTVFGAKGEGIVMLENYNQFKDVVTVLQKSTEGKTNLIFQKYISSSYGRDVRVFVVGGKASGAALRQGAEGSFKSNVSAGGSASPYPLTPAMAELAVKATEALGLTIAGVDLLFDGDQFLIAEVNSCPSVKGFESTTNFTTNIPRLILERAFEMTKERNEQNKK